MAGARDTAELLSSLEREAANDRIEGRYETAEVLYRQALSLATQTFGQCAIETVRVQNNLGVLYKYMGRFPDAWRLYRRALFMVKQLRRATSVASATIYHNLGGLGRARGNFGRGEVFARRSVAIRQEALGPDDPAVAADVAALAAILDARGKRDEAESLY